MMEIIVRNITKDNMIDFSADRSLRFPMPEEELKSILGEDEWIIIDSPIGDELTSITKLNEMAGKYDPDALDVLSQTYLFNELADKEGDDFVIINFDAVTSQWGCGNGVSDTDEWKGLVLFVEGFASLPFEYTPEMEDYIRWENVWQTAETEGWRAVTDGDTYLVKEVA